MRTYSTVLTSLHPLLFLGLGRTPFQLIIIAFEREFFTFCRKSSFQQSQQGQIFGTPKGLSRKQLTYTTGGWAESRTTFLEALKDTRPDLAMEMWVEA